MSHVSSNRFLRIKQTAVWSRFIVLHNKMGDAYVQGTQPFTVVISFSSQKYKILYMYGRGVVKKEHHFFFLCIRFIVFTNKRFWICVQAYTRKVLILWRMCDYPCNMYSTWKYISCTTGYIVGICVTTFSVNIYTSNIYTHIVLDRVVMCRIDLNKYIENAVCL